MEDQLIALRELNVEAAMLDGSSSKAHVSNIQNQMVTQDALLKLLYVTPEKLAKSKRFMSKLEKAYSSLFLFYLYVVYLCSWLYCYLYDFLLFIL